MKKSSILIAVIALSAAVSAVKAEEIKVDFDGTGRSSPKTAHEIFAAGIHMVPVPAVQTESVRTAHPAGVNGSFAELARYFLAQEKIKALMTDYYLARGDSASAASVGDKKVRVAAGEGVVYVFGPGSRKLIYDAELASRVIGIVSPAGQQKFLHPGVLIIVHCMYNDPCWDAVGDGVSAISEWVNS